MRCTGEDHGLDFQSALALATMGDQGLGAGILRPSITSTEAFKS